MSPTSGIGAKRRSRVDPAMSVVEVKADLLPAGAGFSGSNFPVTGAKFPVSKKQFPVYIARELNRKCLQHRSFSSRNKLSEPQKYEIPC
jgi:hypothetical protein